MSHADYDIPAYATWATRVRQHQRWAQPLTRYERFVGDRIRFQAKHFTTNIVYDVDFDRFKLKLQLVDIRLECGVSVSWKMHEPLGPRHGAHNGTRSLQWGNEFACVTLTKGIVN